MYVRAMRRFWCDVWGTCEGPPTTSAADPFPEDAIMASTRMRNVTALDAAFRALWRGGGAALASDVPAPPALLERNAARLGRLPLVDAREALQLVLASTKLGLVTTPAAVAAALRALAPGSRDHAADPTKAMLFQRLAAAMPAGDDDDDDDVPWSRAPPLPPPHTPLPLAYRAIRASRASHASRSARRQLPREEGTPVLEQLHRAGLHLEEGLAPAGMLTRCLDSGQFLRRFRGAGVWVHVLCDDDGRRGRLVDVCARLFPGTHTLITASPTGGEAHQAALRAFAAFPRGVFKHAVAVGSPPLTRLPAQLPAQLASLASDGSFVASLDDGMGMGGDVDVDVEGRDVGEARSLTPERGGLKVGGGRAQGGGGGSRWAGGRAPEWPEWWTGVCADVLSARMRLMGGEGGGGGGEGRGDGGGEGARRLACFHDMVVDRVQENRDVVIGAPLPSPAPAQSRRRHSIVLLDNRENPWSVAALAVTLLHMAQDPDLDLARDWNVCLFCGRQNEAYLRDQLATLAVARGVDVHFVVLPELAVAHRAPAFGYTAYNQLFKSSSFWDGCVQRAESRCLLIQDDGMLCRPGLGAFLARHGHHTYVGAPWQQGQERLREWCGGADSELVGNGGFSLRCPRLMRRLALEGEATGRNWAPFLNGGEQVTPEDVYFVAGIVGGARDAGGTGGIAPREAAQAFSSEQVLTPDSLGFHKVWAYHSDVPLLRRLFGLPPPRREDPDEVVETPKI